MNTPGWVPVGPVLVALTALLAPVVASAQEKTAAATRQYNAAVGLHNGDAYELAAEEWLKFIRSFPSDPRLARAKHYLGVCYSKQDKLQEAAATFAEVVKSYPEFEMLAETLLNLGLTQYNMAHSGKAEVYDSAAETFHTLATKYPQGKHVAEAIFYEGECLYNRGKKKEAAEKYQLTVTRYADHPLAARALFALGVAQADLGQHQAALQTYSEFLRKHPNHALAAEATMWRGETLYALGQYAEAAGAYAASATRPGFVMADYATVRQADALAAVKRYAEAADLYASVPAKFGQSQYVGLCTFEAGKKYYAAGELAKAQPYLAKVLAAGGESAPEAAHWVARSLLKQSQPDEALAVVEKMLPAAGEGPHAASLLMDRADAIYEIPNRRGESAALYAALAAKYPTDPLAAEALYMAAFAAMNQRDYEAALAHAAAFLRAHADDELRVGVLHVMAESNLLLSKFPEAEGLYRELLEKSPDDRDAEIWKVHLGTALYLQKKYPQTIDALQPVIAGIETPDLAAEAWYRIGRSQAALKQFAAAVKSLEAALAAAPKWKLADDTRLVLAYAYQRTNNFDKARQNARRVLSEFPDSKLLPMARYRLAECCRLSGDLKTAVGEYQRILESGSNDSLLRQTLYGLGWAQVGQEDYAAAEATFDAMVAKYADDKLTPRARYGRGIARRQLGKNAPAIEDLQAFLATDPPKAEKSRARHILGLCQKGVEQFDEAVSTFAQLFVDDPDYADVDSVYFEVGWALKSAGKGADAAKAFSALTEKYPDSPMAADSHYLVGDFHYDEKDYAGAARAYYAAMEKAGKTKLGEEAAYKLALAYYMQDDLENAQQTFHYQRVTWPDGPLASDGSFMEAECLFKQQKYEEALPVYAMVKTPSNQEVEVSALLHAGHAAGQLKQWEKSLELLTQCVKQFPDSPRLTEALYEQGWAQQNLGKPDEALAIYGRVVAASNEEPAARAQFMIGEIQFQQKKHAEAVKSFFKVSYGYGYPKWQADATYEAARCFEVMGQKPQALKQYQRVVEKFPQSDKFPLAKERIEALGGS